MVQASQPRAETPGSFARERHERTIFLRLNFVQRVEGACRHLVQDRMGITGARRGLVVAEAVLKLRAIRTSGDWDDYWRFHLQREPARNHSDADAA